MNDDAPLPPTDPAPANEVAPVGKMRTGMKVLLFGSLAVNLLVAGFIVGVVVLGGPRGAPDGSPRLRDVGLGPLAAVLSSDERGELRRLLGQRAPELRETREQMRKDLIALVKALRAEPFDPTALDAALESQSRTGAKLQDIGRSALVDRVAVATPEQRKGLAKRIERALRRGERP